MSARTDEAISFHPNRVYTTISCLTVITQSKRRRHAKFNPPRRTRIRPMGFARHHSCADVRLRGVDSDCRGQAGGVDKSSDRPRVISGGRSQAGTGCVRRLDGCLRRGAAFASAVLKPAGIVSRSARSICRGHDCLDRGQRQACGADTGRARRIHWRRRANFCRSCATAGWKKAATTRRTKARFCRLRRSRMPCDLVDFRRGHQRPQCGRDVASAP